MADYVSSSNVSILFIGDQNYNVRKHNHPHFIIYFFRHVCRLTLSMVVYFALKQHLDGYKFQSPLAELHLWHCGLIIGTRQSLWTLKSTLRRYYCWLIVEFWIMSVSVTNRRFWYCSWMEYYSLPIIWHNER